MSDPVQAQTTAPTPAHPDRDHRLDAEDALGWLTACGQDLDAIEACVPPSRRGTRFTQALASLRQRVAIGEQMQDERRG